MAPQITIKSEDGFISTYTLIKPDNNIYIKEASYPEFVMAYGSTCLVYLAEINSRKVLIKEFFDCNHDVKKDHESITKIAECHSKEYKNYVLTDSNQGFSGHDENGTVYHVFPQFQGDIIRQQIITDEKIFIGVLEEFSDFLDHLNLIHSKYIHWDINASNCIRFGIHSNQIGKCHWELIDFDVSCKIDDTSVYGHGTCRPTSPEWYTDKDLIAYNKLTSDQLAEHRLVLDITAAAKLLSYSICGNTQYRRTPFITSCEGYCSALARIFRKAFNQDLTRRYKSATELKDDIQAIIEAYEKKQFSSAMAWNIREKNNSQLKEIYQVDSLYKVGNHKIDVGILADIKCEELGSKTFSFDEDKGSALEQLLDATNKHIWLVGDAGGGKSTATDYLYLESLRKHFTDVAIVYTKLSDCKFGEDYSTIELNKIVDTSKIIDLRSPVVILLDAYDEIKKRRALGSQQEQEKFDAVFLKAIETAPLNFRFIVTSRFLPDAIKERNDFISAAAQPLNTTQIYSYLLFDNDDINKINGNKTLLELLRNSFYLTMFSNLREKNSDIACHVTNESELIEEYLWAMYENKVGDESNRSDFEHAIGKISTITLDDKYVDEGIYKDRKSFINIFNNYIDLKQIELDKYEVFFAHELIREYFFARGLKDKFSKISVEGTLAEGLNLLDSRYSYNILLLFSQMILSSTFENENLRNKMLLSKIASNYQSIIDNRNKKEQERLNEKMRILQSQGLPQKIIWLRLATASISLEDNGHFPSNLLQIVAFAYGGDLSLFDFGDIRSIPERAFKSCSIIKKIKISDAFETIHSEAFACCEQLREIFVPNSVANIEESAFWGSGIKKIDLSKSLTVIRESTFYNCTNLNNVTIPEGVIEIEGMAFSECENLKKIDFPHSLEVIDSWAFQNTGLTHITIPKELTKITANAFSYCPLETITVDSRNRKYKSIGNCLIETKKDILLLGSKNSKIPLNGEVKYIGEDSFSGCDIENLTVPHGVVAIESCAFSGCASLKSIAFPDTLETINYGAFSNCSKLERIHIPTNVSFIAEGAFKGCLSLTEITADINNVKYQSINNCMIDASTKTLLLGCKNTTIPSDGSVVSIAESAFQKCETLENIVIPYNVLSVGMNAFSDCKKLKSIELSRGMDTIEDSLFWGCEQLSDIIIPDTIERIEDNAFYQCVNLSEISLSEGLKHIGDAVFHTCSKLQFLDIPTGVTSIGAAVFQYCNNLETVTIPITLKSIGDSIFYDCFKLTKVCYEGTKRDWESIIKIAPEGEQWSIGNDHQWSGLSHKFPIKIQCLDGIIEY